MRFDRRGYGPRAQSVRTSVVLMAGRRPAPVPQSSTTRSDRLAAHGRRSVPSIRPPSIAIQAAMRAFLRPPLAGVAPTRRPWLRRTLLESKSPHGCLFPGMFLTQPQVPRIKIRVLISTHAPVPGRVAPPSRQPRRHRFALRNPARSSTARLRRRQRQGACVVCDARGR